MSSESDDERRHLMSRNVVSVQDEHNEDTSCVVQRRVNQQIHEMAKTKIYREEIFMLTVRYPA
jgi:hypothetical protein